MSKEIKLPSGSEAKAKFSGLIYKMRPAHVEINLVPEIKDDAIKAIKLRNLTFFICIIIASASIAITAIFASIAAGQQAIADGKNKTITTLSNKLFSYSDLNNFLTIKDQLSNLSEISSNKTLLSRSFNFLSAIIPTGADTITVSALTINLANDTPTIQFDAQANSGQPPYIDYAVLESFKKSMQYLRYDYGNYVDRYGNIIPAYCMIEHGLDGATLSDPTRGVYAYWLINGEGCNPAAKQDGTTEQDDEVVAYETETYDGQTVVRIWRTPQFDAWYSDTKPENENTPYIDLSGNISGVAHFESRCTTYIGTKNSTTGEIEWTPENNSCLLVPGEDGLKISGSSNGRGGDGELVLRFSATLAINPEFFKFTNPHMVAVGPSGRYNVTDSYVQIQNIFGAPASDCAEGDTACKNAEGGNNG